MARRIRTFDWEKTPLGRTATWTIALKVAVQLMLAQNYATAVYVGISRILLYNDASMPLIGINHPHVLGSNALDTFPNDRFAHSLELAFQGQTTTLTNQPSPFEEHKKRDIEDSWFDISYTPILDEQGEVIAAFSLLKENTERNLPKRGSNENETERRQSEGGNAFLLNLSDSLRAELDKDAVVNTALQMLAEELRLDRCFVTSIILSEDRANVTNEFRRGPLPPAPESFRLSDFPAARKQFLDHTVVIKDLQADPELTELDKKSLLELNYRAAVVAPIRRGTRKPIWSLVAVMSKARSWSADEVALIENVAERTWNAVQRAITRTALNESEERLRVVTDTVQDVFYVTDLDHGKLRYLSPAYEKVWGRSRDHLLTNLRSFLETIHPDDQGTVKNALIDQAKGLPVEKEYRIVRPDGSIRYIFDRCFPVPNAKHRESVGLAVDVTAIKHAEAALRASEVRYRTLFESIDEGFCIVEMIFEEDKPVDFRFLEVNPAFERHTSIFNAVGRRMREIAPAHEDSWFETYGEIALTGKPKRFQAHARELGNRWYDLNAFRVGEPEQKRVAIIFNDITRQRRDEMALRKSEERQAFLLELSDALRTNLDPASIQEEATRLLGRKLSVNRVVYAEFVEEGGQEYVVVEREYRSAGTQSFEGRHPIEQFGSDVPNLKAGSIVAVEDTELEVVSDQQRSLWRALGVRSRMSVPLIKAGRSVVSLGVHSAAPRAWSADDIALVREVGERTWEAVQRARAEAKLRKSEERFRQFANAASDALWIRNADTLKMEYVSPAIEKIYGVKAEMFLNGLEVWASSIIPDDRQIALQHLEEARKGKAVVHEFRIQRTDDYTFRWIKNTDFPLYDNKGRIQRIGGIAEDVTEAKLATEHQAVLLAELQHCVRNIMAIIRSITNRTAETAHSVEEYASLMSGRLLTLARVQALLTRAANVGIDIETLVYNELIAQGQHERQFDIDGPDVVLAPKAAEVLTLAVHELATNALKYGALSTPHGRVSVRWTVFEKSNVSWLSFDWREQGAPFPKARNKPPRRGFGSELIEARIPYELGGHSVLKIETGGAQCHLEFPLQQDASILETGAPQRGIVHGGKLDMTGESSLEGQRILIVEDDYFLATDTAKAVMGAGGDVLGPCRSEDAAFRTLQEANPTSAVLDINLGPGPSFKIAEMLKQDGIPFVFITGYDNDVIPENFETVPRLQKPVALKAIVNTLAAIISAKH